VSRTAAAIAAVVGSLLLTSLSACATAVGGAAVSVAVPPSDRSLIRRYFEDLNESARAGPKRQKEFLRKTQHPDFVDDMCDLGTVTVYAEPAMSTLRPDPTWIPRGAKKTPRGTIYAVGVTVSVRQDTGSVGEQIGSKRVVMLDGVAYGFAPCPT